MKHHMQDHQAKVWSELKEGPATTKELAEKLDLTLGQVAHAVLKLREKGWRIDRAKHHQACPYVMTETAKSRSPKAVGVNRDSFLEVIKDGNNTAEDLAFRFDIKERTAHSLINELRKAGWPIVNLSEPTYTPIYAMFGTRTAPRGRKCALRGCKTVLSMYNHGRYCGLHEGDRE